ncbi:MAG: FGGY-family carbohydrate kinase, partial [Paracoccaceae bacterium]
PKILWLKRNYPALFDRTAKVLTSTSYLTWKLTGEYVIDHYTAANFSPLYDVETLDWTDDLADFLPLDRLPRLGWATDIAGHVTEWAAAETGLAIGTPVTIGTIDAAAEAVSVGVQAPGDMMMMYGSTIFIIQITSARVRDAALWYAPWLVPGQHACMAGLATSGTLTHWFRNELARDADFATLAAEAAASPKGAKGLLCLPYFSGERTPIHDPLAKGAFFGLNLTHGRGDLFRAVLEGVASGTAHVLETCRAAGAAPGRVLAVGGGVKNAVWMQATSDLGQVPQVVCEKTVGASYGDAFLAACAIGAARPEDIAVWNPIARVVTPQVVPAYARQYPLWRALYAQTRDIAHGLEAGE